MQPNTSIQHDCHRWDDLLLAFAAKLRLDMPPGELIRTGVETLIHALRVARVGYGELSEDGLTFLVEHDRVRGGAMHLPSLAGIHRIEAHSYLARVLGQGRCVVMADVRCDAEAAATAETLEAVGIRAQLVLPVMDAGRLAGVFFLHDDQPRDWTDAEIGFTRDAVERVRHAIERSQSEQRLQQLAATLEQQVLERTRALRDSEDFARLALAASGGVGVWTYVVESDRFFCDASISDLYGIDPDAGQAGVSRAEFLANVHPDDMERLRATMSGGLQHSGDLELEYRIRHPDGSVRWVLSRGHTYFDAANQPVRRTGVGIETTGRRQLEEQLRQAQKMESLGQLTGGIAHDFNNLLQGIVLPLQILQRRLGQPQHAGLLTYIEAGMSAAKRAAGLTQRLLAFARRQPLDSRTADLAAPLRELEPMLRNSCGENIVLAMDVSSSLWPVVTDVNQFENAVLNLVINARDAMPTGGLVTVSARNLPAESGHTARNVPAGLPAGDHVCITVADTGTGMAADVIERAFDPFFTTKPIGQGTGLGLSMVYGYARQSGGMAVIDSTVGQGTRISLYFPRAAAQDTRLPATPVAIGPRPSSRQRILVVEDDDIVRRFAVEMLREEGYELREATTGYEAMSVLEIDHGFDLLLTDVGLPGPNGRQVADLARERIPGIKVILMTGYAEEAAHKNTFIGSGMELIVKPFDSEVLLARARRALAG
ncbi:ATP-binding protein [Xylophilus sp. GOD-11R]|uniref:ATP-binding protein n=1 Tax=Xylophilus sp. GOD-11R TaxID=3089814 RepID=UPI00298D26C8|nr:ATP-binding protein [Xylophilus sp. GOD-11R]WPB57704.1 response regulator [Xylophilus sp. GOD-11R]